ncbi:MAG: pilus assembly protein [Actinomycetota bacterium]|nr:pilus assembly protein [Actinomycetota bacterium]
MPSRRPDSGMVTAETALVLPVLLAVTTCLVWSVSLGIAQVRCLDAAREAARLTARGDTEQARAVAEQAAPDDATVTIVESDGLVTVTVSVHARPDLPLLPNLPGVSLSAQAISAAEQPDAP